MKMKEAQMRRVMIAGLLALTAGLSACATATPYQPNIKGQATSGGYSEQRLTTDRFRVVFAGNSLTNRDTVERYMLYRSAELTLAEGYDWFEIDDRRTDRDVQTYVNRDPFAYGPGFYGPRFGYGYGMWQPSWRYYGAGYGWRSWDPWFNRPFFASQIDVTTVQRFEASAEIVLHKGAPPQGMSRAFDAREVRTNLEPTIQRPAPKG
jgi:hypothetical protein